MQQPLPVQCVGTHAAPVTARRGLCRFWISGDAVRWKGRGGTFRRDVGDGEHAEFALAERIYRVPLSELG